MNQDDFDVMVKWLNDKKVLEFYDEPPSDLDRVITKYSPRIEGNHYVSAYIVEYKHERIGYIQHYKYRVEELKKYGYPVDRVIYGIDQFIGETQLWGKGLGTTIIQMMLNYLNISKGASTVVLDVKKNNARAISCYKKCGFREIKELSNDLLLMEWSKV
jgi:aminoglycoside 6'-N-acetyltransferase